MNPCATCHRLTDPLGFAYENYDAIGSYRTTEQGKPIDASGTVMVEDTTLTFKNAVDLGKALAQSNQVRDCVGTQWLRYLIRRSEGVGDEASLQAAGDVFKRSLDVRELMVALVKTKSFTHRAPSAGEMLP